MTLQQHNHLCVSLRDETFTTLVKNTAFKIGSTIHYVVDNPDELNGFILKGVCWTGGAATKFSNEWHIFTSDGANHGWHNIKNLRPVDMSDITFAIWNETLIRMLNMYFGQKF
jgi:hypothetical protein